MINELDFFRETKKGRKAKLYLVLDCETATLPFVNEWGLTSDDKQKIAIAKPLIYDLGWQVVDKKGNIYSRHSFLIQETFFVPNVFNTAYYAEKRPLYMDKLSKGEIVTKTWKEATDILMHDLQEVDVVLAYNAMFDFKKAIPFTESYMQALYSPYYGKWEEKQQRTCKSIISKKQYNRDKNFDKDNFNFRGFDFPMADIWGLACKKLLNNSKYKKMCIENEYITASGQYYKTSAETTFRYLTQDNEFIEEHTALSDAQIESLILSKILSKGSIEIGIIYFPFKILGNVEI